MYRCLLLLLSVLLVFPAAPTRAQEPSNSKPIRALLVTGGCCHDYARQKLILTKGISARANVVWTVVQQGGKTTNAKIPLYEDKNWSEGFDIVVHNECFSHVKDIEWVDNILKPHREGLPAVLIHCAMHCYRTGDDRWFEFVGMQSPGHGPHYSYKVEPYAKDHFIMKGFGDGWQAPKGELYHSMKMWTSATPLAAAKRKSDKQPQVCVWTNQYRKGRVFGTTIGHYNETMADPKYLDMVTRGMLWAVGRADEQAIRKTTAETNEEVRKLATIELAGAAPAPSNAGACCGQGNLAFNRPAKAKSEESNKNNLAVRAVDGNLGTRWCAAGGARQEWWQVDLGDQRQVKSLRIHWEKANSAYQYKVYQSADATDWKVLVDASKNKKKEQASAHQVDAKARHLRVEFLGSSTGSWGSIWEFEAYEGELPPLPKPKPGATPGATLGDVQAPAGFDVRLFGAPPQVNYPVCLTAAATGEVFVGIDEQGSLGKEKGRGRIVRCVDVDGDGSADQVNEFAKVDHPRGLIYDAGRLWCLHPPYLTLFTDDNFDGVADREEVLIEGISTDQVARRGADHTTNGIRMGIDGWIYIAVGDFGFTQAKAKDGRVLSRRGGGIVRIRPDGSNMEIYAWGLRNILDVCIDPEMNIFTRDNTNDGGGWNVRLSHILQTANYGYPSLYLNYTDEIMPTLKDYGGGSGCGGMYLHDPRWPSPFGDAGYTCDWGRSEVYRHNLPTNGPTFDAHQEVFAKIPRPTDIDVDGSGRMYISSWKNGKFNFSGENVGFVAQLTPKDFLPKPFPNLAEATLEQLAGYHKSPSAVYRLHSQLEILRRGDLAAADHLAAVAADSTAPLYGRVAAIYTWKQLAGAKSHPALAKFAGDDALREHVLRALTDRKDQMEDVPADLYVAALQDANPRVVNQALIGLGRIGKSDHCTDVLRLAMPPETVDSSDDNKTPEHARPNPDKVIPHLAVQTLVACRASKLCLEAIGGEHEAAAIRALKQMHATDTVGGLIQTLGKQREAKTRRALLSTLMRLYYREGKYTGGWWGTRPDRTGPYFDRKPWDSTDRIGMVLKTAIEDASPAMAKDLVVEARRLQLKIEGLDLGAEPAATPESTQPISVPTADPNNPKQLGNMSIEEAIARVAKTASGDGDVNRGRMLFKRQSCVACHTVADGQTPKGPHLVDIGKRYKRAELIESILKPSAKIAQGFDTYAFRTDEGKVVTGFVVGESAETIKIRQSTGVMTELLQDEIERRVKQKVSMMPQGVANNLTAEELNDLLAYLQSLRSF